MRPDKLTTRLQQGLAEAQSLAAGRDHQYIEPAHLLSALLNADGGGLKQLFKLAGADSGTISGRLQALLDRLSKISSAGR